MWCRAILVAATVTYILCVLVLNGVQKEDLDVSMLRKLQRHNVNIEDMNNEGLLRECGMLNRSSSTQNTNERNTDLLNSDHQPVITEKREESNIKLSDSNLQNIIINYFNNVQKPNKSVTIKNDDVGNFMNIWNTMRTMDYVQQTTKAIESSTLTPKTLTYNKLSNENIEYINKMLENFINIQTTTTTPSRPNTSQLDYDLIISKIQEMLAKSTTTQPSVQVMFGRDKINEGIQTLHNDSIQYIDDNKMKLDDLFKMFETITEKKNKKNMAEDRNVQHIMERRYLADNAGFKKINTPDDSRNTNYMNKQIQPVSVDIIKELSDSVRAKVLQDLNKIITPTASPIQTKFNAQYTTIKPMIHKSIETPSNYNLKYENKSVATDVLEKFMKMYNQMQNKESTEPSFAKRNNENEYARIKNNGQESYSPANANVMKSVPINITSTSVILNPFNPNLPVVQTAIIPNQPPFLTIHSAFQNPFLPLAQSDHKMAQLNIINTKNNFHAPPITIQTNSVEVPPLGLPAVQSVVYQNILVSTKRPFYHNVGHELYKVYKSQERHEDRKYDDRKYKDQHSYLFPRSRERYDTIGRHDKIRDYKIDYSKDNNRHEPTKYQGYSRSHYNDRNNERFHEKLERADDWPRIPRDRSEESRNIDDDYNTPKLISRHQLPLSSTKKRTRYHDAHFRNFMKTQQKVNDMLERILATKAISTGPRSVETTVS